MNKNSPQMRINLDKLKVIRENDDEKFLKDGSVLKELEDDVYALTYPDGTVAKYRNNDGEDELFLYQVKDPHGEFVIYDYKQEYDEGSEDNVYKQVKIYERDGQGHFTLYKYEIDEDDGEIGDLLETVKGTILDEYKPEANLDFDDLPVVYEKGNEKFLRDGSYLEELEDDKYSLEYPNGQKAKYHYEDNEEKLFLDEVNGPNGKYVIYDYKIEYDEEKEEDVYTQIKVYERDERGNFTSYQYERDYDNEIVGDLLDTITGNINDVHDPELDWRDVPVIYKDGDKHFFADGSVLEELDDDISVRKYPNGAKAFYHYNLYERDVFLTRYEEPDGKLVVYGYQKVHNEKDDKDEYQRVIIYERDANGNYVYNKYEDKDDEIVGDLSKTIKGKVGEKAKFEMQTSFNALPVIYEENDISYLADGLVLEDIGDNYYTLKSPNGQKAEYFYSYRDELLLLKKEEDADGKLVVYDYSREYDKNNEEIVYTPVKIYERDASGNYVYYKYEKTDGKIGLLLETVKGSIHDPYQIPEMMEFDDLSVVYERDSESLLVDGSVLTELNNGSYERKYPNGDRACYYYNYNEEKLFLSEVEEANGRLVQYEYKKKEDEDEYQQIITYQREADGHFVRYEYEDAYYDEIGKLLVVTEGYGEHWDKKTFYDEDEKPSYYQLDGDETKKYYPSGQLMEEERDDVTIGYYDTGVVKSEEYSNGAVKKYAPNSLVLEERDEEGNYLIFKLNRDGNGTLLVEKGKRVFVSRGYWDEEEEDVFSEQYEYDKEDYLIEKKIRTDEGVLEQVFYPGPEQKLKEETKPDGTITQWSIRGKKTYELFPDKSYIKYLSDRDYKMYDEHDHLLEDVNVFGKTVYTYYAGTDQIKHIHKYNENGDDVISGYRHFTKTGLDDTKYYLARRRYIAERIKKEDEEAKRKGIERIKAIKKKSGKITKFIDHMRAMREIKDM